jgi:hypothetical protein
MGKSIREISILEGKFCNRYKPDGRIVVVPCWVLVLLSGSLATVPCIPWSRRFSLRTLLIAMTLVAAGLGVIVYASR